MRRGCPNERAVGARGGSTSHGPGGAGAVSPPAALTVTFTISVTPAVTPAGAACGAGVAWSM
jgi:hypothetical protein